MSDCCTIEGHGSTGVRTGRVFACPVCHQKGRAVSIETVQALARDDAEVTGSDYRFCRTPDCSVVYFDPDSHAIAKSQVRVRVGIKEAEDPIPVCYCFGFTRADIFEDIRAKGSTSIPDKIRAEVQADNCACKVKNPSGTCCLGDVSAAAKHYRQFLDT